MTFEGLQLAPWGTTDKNRYRGRARCLYSRRFGLVDEVRSIYVLQNIYLT